MGIIRSKLDMEVFQVKKLTQPQLGHLEKSNIQPLRYLKEFRTTQGDEFEIGQVLNVNSFLPGQLVNVKGKNIGKDSLVFKNVITLLVVL
nr:hypothetical protein DMDDKFKA_00160 [Haslea ostrearia]